MKTKNFTISNDHFSELIWKIAIGTALSWELAKLFGSEHPYLAPISVILCQQSTNSKTVKISIQRVTGTVIGIFITVLVASFIPVNGGTLGLIILFGCFITKFLKFDKVVVHQVALTILFVFALGHKEKHYAMDRMIDTLIGVAIVAIIQVTWSRLISRKKQ
ncbi:FUSC family protein [Bacillus sp. Bva_UNVM-123]|uniref:FUSC family protein n=1 Tax=Bacillus sp. Bva_UNVM-123 TaxID=2829798 RepID=UPI00391F5219